MLARVRELEAEDVALSEVGGRFLAKAVAAAEDVPAFDNSAMDGFAVRAADTAGARPESPRALAVVDESRAGHPAERKLVAGEAIAISTGAMMPFGADAVVRLEDCEREGRRVLVAAEVAAGRSVRRAGDDVRAGTRLLGAGARLGAAELGALAAIGRASACCTRRPVLRALVTGDELVPPGEPLAPGQIRDSNAYTVPALARDAGASVASVETAPDEPEATVAALARALSADVAVVCGGVSVGEHDHVRPALASLGVEEVFWGVSLRPGKPTYFGVAPANTLVFGLPGNPVSAMVTFILFVRPALLAMQGGNPAARRIEARMADDHEKARGRAEAIRVRLSADERGSVATPTGPQGSHVLTSMLGADGLAFAPAGREVIHAGESLPVELLT